MLLKTSDAPRRLSDLYSAAGGIGTLVFARPYGDAGYPRFKVIPHAPWTPTTVLRGLAESLRVRMRDDFVLDDGWTESGGARGRIARCVRSEIEYLTPPAAEDWDFSAIDADLARAGVEGDLHASWPISDACIDAMRREAGANVDVDVSSDRVLLTALDVYGPGGARAGVRRALRHEARAVAGRISLDCIMRVLRAAERCETGVLWMSDSGAYVYGPAGVIAGLCGRRRAAGGILRVRAGDIRDNMGRIPFFD